MAQGKPQLKFEDIRALSSELPVIATRTDDGRTTYDGQIAISRARLTQ